MNKEYYTCYHCKGRFPKVWTDEEALAEKDELFPNVLVEDCVLVCDDCFGKLNKRFEEIKKELNISDN